MPILKHAVASAALPGTQTWGIDILRRDWSISERPRELFVSIVKWSGLFYDIRDNGPDERTPTSLYRSPNRTPPKASPDGLGLGTAPGREDYGLPVDQRCVS